MIDVWTDNQLIIICFHGKMPFNRETNICKKNVLPNMYKIVYTCIYDYRTVH